MANPFIKLTVRPAMELMAKAELVQLQPLLKVLGAMVTLAIVTRILLHGLQGSLTIHGETYDLVMPAQSLLSDQQMADVATYVRGQWGNKTEPVTGEFDEKTRVDNKNQNGRRRNSFCRWH